jgi:hypothetical protein
MNYRSVRYGGNECKQFIRSLGRTRVKYVHHDFSDTTYQRGDTTDSQIRSIVYFDFSHIVAIHDILCNVSKIVA